jgi:predicted Zn-dependent peptidase
MMQNSLIDREELKREELVVLEEIRRSEDEPGDHVHEVHISERWGLHPLGKPIIGTPESVAGFEPEHIQSYMDRRYRSENILLSVAGNVDPAMVVEAAERLLSSIPTGAVNDPITRPNGSSGLRYVEKDVEQVHFCIGTDGCSHYDDALFTLAVLDGALGGSMSSRLFQEIREKRGLAYSVGSYTLTYSSGGAFTVYGGTSVSNWDLVQSLVREEFARIAKEGLEPEELARTKRHIEGSIVLGLEGMNGRMMRMSRNELNHERIISIEETIAKVNAVTNASIIELAQQLFSEDRISTTVIGPAK